MSPQQAHIHILENTPRERIRKHEQRFDADARRQGVPRLLTGRLVDRYRALKAEGMKYKDIKRELRTSGRMMKRLKEAA